MSEDNYTSCMYCGKDFVHFETPHSIGVKCPENHFVSEALKFAVSVSDMEKMIALVDPGVLP